GHGPAGSVDETAMQLGDAPGSTTEPRRERLPPPEVLRAETARDPCSRHPDDAMARESRPDREIEARVRRLQTRIESAQPLPHRAADEQRRRRDGEHIALGVVLRLVEVPVDERDGRAVAAHALAEGD